MRSVMPRSATIGRACLGLAILSGFVFLWAGTLTAARGGEPGGLALLPRDFTLSGPEFRQRLLVETVQGETVTGQVSEGAEFQVEPDGVVKIEDGSAVPVGNGTAEITVRVGALTAKSRVTVADFERPHAWSFRNHVQSVLSKKGCNSGACHGALAGKKGFKLSLHGYDSEADFLMITRQSRGRRVVPSDPGRSLLLTKPSGAIPHKGGVRFRVDSPEYRVLAEWIASGHPGPELDDPTIERLEILPQAAVLQPGAKQQLVVRALFSDGRAEDVTRWAKFTTTNGSAAQVDDDGLISVMGHGEASIVAWYQSRNVIATATIPYATAIAEAVFSESPRNNFVDDLVLRKLEQLNVPPSPDASDAEFLRRAYLDTLGLLPTTEEARAFLADESPDKRARLVDLLLTRPEFVDYWSYKWSDLLLVSGERLRPEALKSYYEWIRTQVEENTPWDEFARRLVTAKGSTFENGAANFYALHQDPLDMAETVSMAFLGMSINCARCHNHPLEKWTNDDYYGMASLFSRVRGKGWGGDFRNGDGLRTIFVDTDGELIQPRTGRPQVPRPLDGEPIAFDDAGDRRLHLAEWLTAAENPYFSRAIVNRVWANFLGVGIVESVDDVRLSNPPSNEELFAALSAGLEENGYDLKWLMRTILTSRTYQRSSVVLPGNAADERYYSRTFPRRLQAEVLLDAISQATGVPTTFAGQAAGTRALQLRDSAVESYFLATFGRPDRLITCECERSGEPSMVQVLHLVNGDTLNAKLETEQNAITELLATGLPNYRLVEELYLRSLSRYPTDAEMAGILQVLAETPAGEQRHALEDLYWGILSSREFLFNH